MILYRTAWSGFIGLVLLLTGCVLPSTSTSAEPRERVTPPRPTTPPVRSVAVASSGNLLVNRTPIFPVGMYNVSYFLSDEERLQTLQTVADAGFNTIHEPIDADDNAFLDAATERGVYVIAEFNAEPTDVASIYAEHPAVLAWNVADDVDDGTQSPQEVWEQNEAIQTASPERATYVSGAFLARIDRFYETADVIGFQAYPIDNGGLPLNYVDRALAQVVSGAQAQGRPVIANLQAFAWEDGRAPTASELRNMTYQALINNVRGVLYYTFYDGSWALTDNVTLWQEAQLLAGELQAMTPLLLAGDATRLATGNEDVLAAAWQQQGREYVVVINTSQTTGYPVTVPLTLAGASTATPVFAERPAGMVVEAGALVGQVEAEAVHVYVIE